MRIALIPFFVALLHFPQRGCRVAALIVFCLAALTDFLDGKIARKYGIVTTFGKFVDPVADKLLVLSAMITLCGLQEFPIWACVIVLFRELCVDGLRLVAAEQGRVIAAGKLGKLKTTIQLLTLILFMLDGRAYGADAFVLGTLMVWLTVAITLWSGADYFLRNRSVLSFEEKPKERDV